MPQVEQNYTDRPIVSSKEEFISCKQGSILSHIMIHQHPPKGFTHEPQPGEVPNFVLNVSVIFPPPFDSSH